MKPGSPVFPSSRVRRRPGCAPDTGGALPGQRAASEPNAQAVPIQPSPRRPGEHRGRRGSADGIGLRRHGRHHVSRVAGNRAQGLPPGPRRPRCPAPSGRSPERVRVAVGDAGTARRSGSPSPTMTGPRFRLGGLPREVRPAAVHHRERLLHQGGPFDRHLLEGNKAGARGSMDTQLASAVCPNCRSSSSKAPSTLRQICWLRQDRGSARRDRRER